MQERKRVVHITTVHNPHDPRIFYKQCLSLQKAGYDVTLIAQGDAKDQKVQGIEHIRLKKYKSRMKRMIFGTLEAYKIAKKLDAHVYHFHDPELMFMGWLLKNKNNVVIYDIHEDYVTSILQKNYMNKIFRTFIAKAYKMIEGFLTRKMELCLAEKYYKDIYKRGRCILNYPIINNKLIEHNYNDQPVANKLLYTGNVTEDRGALIHAALPLIDEHIEVYFVGKCSKKLADAMVQASKHKSNQLVIEGIDQFINKERIEEMYLSKNWLAGIALFPETDHYKKKELTKFFEYMAAGLPILCSNFPVWEEFIDTYKCGIAVDPNDDEQIKEALNYLRENPEQAKQMGENGKRAVLNTLNWSAEENKLINWYKQLLA